MSGPINKSGTGGLRPYGQPSVQRDERPAEEVRQAPVGKGQELDAQRMVSGAGFVRQGSGPEGKLNLGDYARAPIPLDPRDVDPKGWRREALSRVTEHLLMKSAKLKEIAKNVQDGDPWLAALTLGLLGRPDRALGRWKRKGRVASDEPSPQLPDEDVELVLEDDPATAEAVKRLDMGQLRAHLAKLFGVEMPAGKGSVAETLLAAGLVVAGKADSVQASGDGHVNAAALLEGLTKAFEEGKEAVQQFEQMHSKINRQVNVQRMFMFKR